MGLGAFISVGKSLETALQRVELAERLAYESAYVTHIAARDSVTTLMAYACRSERLVLGTGVTPIYSRTPVAAAQSFATLDEFSGGRALIGLGVSHRPVVEAWYGQRIEKPLREMREYVGVVRAILRGEDPPQGERFASSFHFMGYEPRPDIPIYLAGLSPGMLRLAGEIADGVILWLCNPDYIRDVVVPTVAEGREKAGKSPEGFDIVAAVPSAVTSDPEQAKAQLRSELIPYFSLPFYRKMLERSRLEEDIAAFDRGMQEGGPEAAEAAISERFLSSLAAIGSADEAAASVSRYAESGATSPCLGGISKTDFDTTLEALAGCLG
ncbi:MAG: LLM class flavin-dependent oxidoreductase [Thermoleophilaceae bacterium]|nr:LLM class flavin-dependent oxidoreductase [Thermoleophilaceae bacterium]